MNHVLHVIKKIVSFQLSYQHIGVRHKTMYKILCTHVQLMKSRNTHTYNNCSSKSYEMLVGITCFQCLAF